MVRRSNKIDRDTYTTLTPVLLVKVAAFCAYTGYTEKAVERKRQDGVWVEGVHWYKAPDGNIIIDLLAYYAWCRENYDPNQT